MTTDSNPRSLVGDTIRDLRSSWKSLALTDIAFKIVTFIVLTPLVGVLFRILIATSGRAVLSDLDVLFFFLGPAGWFCFIVIGALWLGIFALEQASLLGIICARTLTGDPPQSHTPTTSPEDGRGGFEQGSRHLGTQGALRFAAANAWPVVQVTARIIAYTLLTVAPFLAGAAVVYFTLLTEFDINYYLKERPPAFFVALGIGGIIMVALIGVLLRLFTSWFFSLPLVLFENVSSRDALRVSGERAHGHRRSTLVWIVGWALVMTVLSALATSLVGYFGRLVVPSSTGSLHLLAITIGVILLIWAGAGLVVNLISTTTFAAILFNLYRYVGGHGRIDNSKLVTVEPKKRDTGFQMTTGRLLIVGIAGVVVAAAIGVFAQRSVRLEDDVKVMAHRGSSKAAPENTMAAIKKAIEDGADWVEIDVQETADGEVVVFHDSDFMKLAGVNLKIWNATREDLNSIDIGSWFAPKFKNERVPTLDQVLDVCKGKIGVNIELKYYGHDEQLEQRVADIVDSRDMASAVVLMSLKGDAVKKMLSIRPDWTVGLLMSVFAGDLKKVEADFLAVNAGFVDRRFVRAAHAVGKEVYVWTVNDAPTMSTMISRGIDGLLTDKPALACSVLEQRAQMSAPERLLLELTGILGAVPELGEQ